MSQQRLGEPTFWELEALANAFGELTFKHQSSVTENLLEISSMSGGRTKFVTVSAFGYRGIPRVDYVPILGGDGKVHPVPVSWVEYLPVTRETQVAVGVLSNEVIDDDSEDGVLQKNWNGIVHQYGAKPEDVWSRASFAMFLLNGAPVNESELEQDEHYAVDEKEVETGPADLAAAEAGDVMAMVRTANSYLVLGELILAFNWFVRALRGHTGAYRWTFTAAFCAKRIGNWENFSQALVKAADRNGVDAMLTLGFFAEENGDIATAQSWYERASSQGDSRAKQNLAMCINDVIFSYCIPNKEWGVVDYLAQKAISLEVPNQSTNALSNWAISKYLAGEVEKAKTLFIQALEQTDKFAESEASYYLSQIFWNEGNSQLAEYYQTRCANAGGYNPRHE
jgi:TPR repeat protein